MSDISGKRIAILATDGFEQAELFEPKQALEQAGAKTEVISLQSGKIKAWDRDRWGEEVSVDLTVADANPSNYDALLLPGGVLNPDKLRTDPKAVAFAKYFVDNQKLVASICHGPWLLVEADVLRGKSVTSWPSLKTDIRNAGGEWVDQQVQTDGNLITSRKPADIPAFNKAVIEALDQTKAAGVGGR